VLQTINEQDKSGMKEALMDASTQDRVSTPPSAIEVPASSAVSPSSLYAAAPAVERIHDEIAADTARGETMVRFMHAWQGRFTDALSPGGLMLAYFYWVIHLANAPGKRSVLVEKALRKWLRFARYAAAAASNPECPSCIEPLPQDPRFVAPEWRHPPASIPSSREGSWWPAWVDWLVGHSSERITPPGLGDAEKGSPLLAAAPGGYVLDC
jgi:hypothetical protein